MTGWRPAMSAGGPRSSLPARWRSSTCSNRPSSSGAVDLLDVGIGTGNLAIPAVQRWPSVRVTGIDASSEMAGTALALADDRLAGDARSRLDARTAVADALPFEDGSFDAAMSSFVFQLVPSRARAFREVHRVLRSGRHRWPT